jgi:NTP pyrophosphatase (non-canonical NTP hydrolase)
MSEEFNPNISFKEAIAQIHTVISRYQKAEGVPWGATGAMIELQKQVGELAKLIMLREKFYVESKDVEVSDVEVADELADVFYAITRIAKHYGIDLVKANHTARELEWKFLEKKMCKKVKKIKNEYTLSWVYYYSESSSDSSCDSSEEPPLSSCTLTAFGPLSPSPTSKTTASPSRS